MRSGYSDALREILFGFSVLFPICFSLLLFNHSVLLRFQFFVLFKPSSIWWFDGLKCKALRGYSCILLEEIGFEIRLKWAGQSYCLLLSYNKRKKYVFPFFWNIHFSLEKQFCQIDSYFGRILRQFWIGFLKGSFDIILVQKYWTISCRIIDCYSRVRKLNLIPMSPIDCLLEIN